MRLSSLAMDDTLKSVLTRIADALERLAPPPKVPPAFEGGRLFRHDPVTGAFAPAPDYPLPLDLLVGVDRQKARSWREPGRFADGLP